MFKQFSPDTTYIVGILTTAINLLMIILIDVNDLLFGVLLLQ